LEIPRETEARVLARARLEGVSVDILVGQLIEEREQLAATVERAEAHAEPFSREQAQATIERGFVRSERGEVSDGETFARDLLIELEEIERTRRTG
jgi:hypothetical protein